LATPAVEPSTLTPKARPPLQSLAHKSVITIYRVFAITVLYAVLVGVFSYAFVMGFYALNHTWVGPIILSAYDEKSLDFMQKLVISRQSIEDLKVDVTRQQTTIAEMNKQRASLVALDPELQTAIAREREHDRTTGPQLAALDVQKQADNAKTKAIVAQIHELEARIESDRRTHHQGRRRHATRRAQSGRGRVH
jgi:hypothetical protein